MKKTKKKQKTYLKNSMKKMENYKKKFKEDARCASHPVPELIAIFYGSLTLPYAMFQGLLFR